MPNNVLAFYFLQLFHFSGEVFLEMLIAPIITIFYFIKVKRKPLFFSLFLLVYSIGDLISFFDQQSYNEAIYFLCNGLFMLAYVFLLLEIVKTVSLRQILKKFPIHFVVLSILNIYIMFVMVTIINPILFETNHLLIIQMIEQTYNILLLSILSMSFFNYILNENNKSLLLFCGCLAITFSEFLWIGYFYLSEEMAIIRFVSILLELSAFLLFYFQATLKLNTSSSNSYI